MLHMAQSRAGGHVPMTGLFQLGGRSTSVGE